MPVLDRFLRYVRIDTRADEASATCPSTPGQLTLQRLLAAELEEIGLPDVTLDEHGYLMATIPATVAHARADHRLHRPRRHVARNAGRQRDADRPRAWDGRDIVLPDDPTAVLRAADDPDLAAQVGHDIVTASGTTLLGADDKAGVAAIVAAAEYLMAHPEIPHGPIRIGFTPDEEIGRGANLFDVARFGAVCAYTLDGGNCGELEVESFSADAMRVTFIGFNTHPGYAKGRMVNAIKAAARFVDRLPQDRLSPETTDGVRGVRPSLPDGRVGGPHHRPRAAARLRHERPAGEAAARRADRRRRRRGHRHAGRVPGGRAVPQHARDPRPPSRRRRARARRPSAAPG